MKTFNQLKEALNQSNLMEAKVKATEFFSQIYSSVVSMHFFHLTTSSYAAHVASNEFYTGLPPLLDSLMESFSGRYGKLEVPPKLKVVSTDGLSIAVNLLQWIDANRAMLSDDTELQNIIDEITGLINSTIYKLRELK
jgi:Family of unknown function (DUF5856)